MVTRKRSRSVTPIDMEAITACMDEWPKSWAGVDEDKEPGARLVVELRRFVAHLGERGLTARTIRTHRDNLWVIGGEIIRDFHDEPSLRGRPARQLILDAIGHGEAPLLYGASAEDQGSADATARKFLRFLRDNDDGR